MHTQSLNMAGHACCVAPLERHEFKSLAPDSFECDVCHRPRAMHAKDGFYPNSAPPRCCMLPSVRYGPHPYFTKPGSLKDKHLPDDEPIKYIRPEARQRNASAVRPPDTGQPPTTRPAGTVTTPDKCARIEYRHDRQSRFSNHNPTV